MTSMLRRVLARTPLLWRIFDQHAGPDPESLPEGRDGVRAAGHREYVGGKWEEIGRLQFRFLVEQGVRPGHYLLDVGCGCLRAGVLFIPYLERGHYMGIDKEKVLLRRGIEEELGRTLYDLKRPRLVVSSSFDFERFDHRPDFALAQSLFTHLTDEDIRLCLRRLRPVMPEDGRFYATFFETSEPVDNRQRSHARLPFWYTREQMQGMAAGTGWDMTYIGDWSHPRDQKMLLFRPD